MVLLCPSLNFICMEYMLLMQTRTSKIPNWCPHTEQYEFIFVYSKYSQETHIWIRANNEDLDGINMRWRHANSVFMCFQYIACRLLNCNLSAHQYESKKNCWSRSERVLIKSQKPHDIRTIEVYFFEMWTCCLFEIFA